mgnify:CR=1 FL=1
MDSRAAAEFADKIKEAVAAEDLEALADLTAFPVYVDIENANDVKTREDFLALGAEAIFTEELKNVSCQCRYRKYAAQHGRIFRFLTEVQPTSTSA